MLYQSILNAKLTGRKKLGRKMCTSNKDDRKLENTVNKADSNTWESHKSELKLESVHQDTTLRHLQEKGYQATSEINIVRSILPGLRRKITGLFHSGPNSSFQIKLNFAFHCEIKVPESGGRVRGTESMLLEVQCEVSSQ